MTRTYNRTQPTVFVTVQMYLSAAPARLEQVDTGPHVGGLGWVG